MPTSFARGNGFFSFPPSSVSPGLPAAHLPNRIFGGSPARVPRTIKSPWHHPAQPPLAQLASQGLVDHPIGLSTAPAPVQSVHCAHRPVMYIHARPRARAHRILASPRLSLAESPSCPVADARRGAGDSPASARPLEIRNSDRVEFCRTRERKGQSRNRQPVVARCAFDEGIQIHRARAFAHRLLDRSCDIEASAPRNGKPRWGTLA